MAYKVGNTEVISNGRALNNITAIDSATAAAIGAGGVGGGKVSITTDDSLVLGDSVGVNSNGRIEKIGSLLQTDPADYSPSLSVSPQNVHIEFSDANNFVVSCTDGSTASYLIGGYIDSSGNVNWGSWTTLSNANGISANSYNGRLFHHSGTTWTYFYSNSSGNYKKQ